MRTAFLSSALSLITLLACSATTGTVGNETCTPSGSCGATTIEACVTSEASGACTGARYKAGNGQSFSCASCEDCTDAAQAAEQACAGTTSSSGSDGSGSGSSGGGTGTACSAGTTCVDGSTMNVCTSVDMTGACTSITYTVDSKTFTCVGCSNCSAVQAQASQACAQASGSSGSGSSGSSGGSGSGSSGSGSSGSGSSGSGSSGSGSGSSSGGGPTNPYDGTTGKACATDADCHSANGPGTNRCTNDGVFAEGPVYPTPICLTAATCNPGTDGNLHYCDGPDDPSSPGVCLSTGTAGDGLCLPQCTFAPGGGFPAGCVGKDICYPGGYSAAARRSRASDTATAAAPRAAIARAAACAKRTWASA